MGLFDGGVLGWRRATRPDRPPQDVDSSGQPIPSFAKNFPDDPRLNRLVLLFEQGNYAAVRAEAPALIKGSEDPEVRAAAEQLVKRLEPDPLALYLLGIAAALLVALAGWYWTHPGEGATPQGPPPSNNAPAPGPAGSSLEAPGGPPAPVAPSPAPS